jgi:hypothetical protein
MDDGNITFYEEDRTDGVAQKFVHETGKTHFSCGLWRMGFILRPGEVRTPDYEDNAPVWGIRIPKGSIIREFTLK